MQSILGVSKTKENYLFFHQDELTHSPVLLFQYPTNAPSAQSYIEPRIKLEFGSLTDQRPMGAHPITSWVAEEFPGEFQEAQAQVVAMEAERTFWEKATILHAEYHRAPDKPMRLRHSRDFYDLYCLAQHPAGARAISDMELLNRVVQFKEKFFPSSWANYASAKPGTFKMTPPDHRLLALQEDYRKMHDMFFEEPPGFQEILKRLREIENQLNKNI